MKYEKCNRNTLANFYKSRSRYIHISAPIVYEPDPRVCIDGIPRPDVPTVQKLGKAGTYRKAI